MFLKLAMLRADFLAMPLLYCFAWLTEEDFDFYSSDTGGEKFHEWLQSLDVREPTTV